MRVDRGEIGEALGPKRSPATRSHVPGEDGLQWWARARCDGCGLDYLRRFTRWAPILDQLAAAGSFAWRYVT